MWVLWVGLTALTAGCGPAVVSTPASSPVPVSPLSVSSVAVTTAPVVDGQVEALWDVAPEVSVPLLRDDETALDVEVRSVHTGQSIYFLARWPGPPGSGDVSTNVFTVHWRVTDDPVLAEKLACTVACHTVYATSGTVDSVNDETIPQGHDETLQARGGWHAGVWSVEWTRPLRNDNPFDVQFAAGQARRFLLKVFLHQPGQSDPVSEAVPLIIE